MGKKYFTVRELTKSYTTNQHGIDNTPDEEQKKNLEDLIDVCLDPLRIFYPQKLLVYSGFRSFELNIWENLQTHFIYLDWNVI